MRLCWEKKGALRPDKRFLALWLVELLVFTAFAGILPLAVEASVSETGETEGTGNVDFDDMFEESTLSPTWAEEMVLSGETPLEISPASQDIEEELLIEEPRDLEFISRTRTAPIEGSTINFGGSTFLGTGSGGEESNKLIPADVDNDGLVDLVTAGGSGRAIWENTGKPFDPWTSVSIGSGGSSIMDMAVVDLDNDGLLDIVEANAGSKDINIWQNDGSPFESWEDDVDIGSPGNEIYEMEPCDLDNDGDMDMISGDTGHNVFVWENDGTPFSGEEWSSTDVGNAGGELNALATGDFDNDGDIDFVTGDDGGYIFLWKNDGNPWDAWTSYEIGSRSTSTICALAVGDMDRDGDLDIVNSDREPGNSEAYVWENDGTPFEEEHWNKNQVLQSTRSQNNYYSLELADLDNDGDLDIGCLISYTEVRVLENDGSPFTGSWELHILGSTGGAYVVGSIRAVDIDHDGDLDVLTYDDHSRIHLWENVLIHRSLVFEDGVNLGDAPNWVRSTPLADLDNDGDLDVISGDSGKNVYVWENDGSPFESWTGTDIGDADQATNNVCVGDLDNDGDLDLASCHWGTSVYVWENDGTPFDGSWSSNKIGSTAGGDARALTIGDFDNDGDLDLATGDDGGNVYVWENDGTPFTGSWTGNDIGNSGNVNSVTVADLDNDGYLDVISGDSSSNVIIWQNDNTPFTGTWPDTDIGNAGGGVFGVVTEDLDNDGYLDLVSADAGDKVYLWQNDGTPFGGSWSATNVGDVGADVRGLAIGDLDGNGWNDIVSGDYADEIILWKNDKNPFSGGWNSMNVGSADGDIWWVSLGDLDGDGDLDVVSGDESSSIFAWQNIGAQMNYTVTDTSPNRAVNGETYTLLELNVTNNGLASDNALELNTWNLSFLESNDSPLSSAEANALVDQLQIYLDDGDGSWDMKKDTRLLALDTLSLSGGKQRLEFTDQDLRVRIPGAASKTYFAVLILQDDASDQNPKDFKLAFDPDVDSLCSDRFTGASLSVVDSDIFKIQTLSPQSVITVDDGGGQDYTKIQDAIDAAQAGDVIQVYAGTYSENVEVDKKLKLVGDSWTSSIIQGDGTDDTLTISADGVQLSGFYITDSGVGNSGIKVESDGNRLSWVNSTDNDYGIVFSSSSDNTLDNVTIEFNELGEDTVLETGSVGNVFVDSDPGTVECDATSELTVNIHLAVEVLDASGVSIQGADIGITDNDDFVYASPHYGGWDIKTDSLGKQEWLLVTDRVYEGSSTATENETEISVYCQGLEATRTVSLSYSHPENFTLDVKLWPPEGKTMSFGGSTNIGSGPGEGWMTAGDFDNDGWTDLLSGNYDDRYLWKNNGTPFEDWTATDIGDGDAHLNYLRTADLDNDGQLDIVECTRTYTCDINIRKNDGNPWGSWDPKIDIGGVGHYIIMFDLGDFDGDGDLDIVSVDVGYNVYVWENDKTPFIGGEWSKMAVGSTPYKASAVACGDLDMDGDVDFVTGDEKGYLSVWENDGTPFTGHWTAFETGILETRVDSIELADLDLDGDLDIVSSEQGGDATIWENDKTPFRDAHWSGKKIYDNYHWTTNRVLLCLTDFDLDGDVDISMNYGTEIYILENPQNPFQRDWETSYLGDTGGSYKLGGLEAADIDHDGDFDIVSYDDHAKFHIWENTLVHRNMPFAGEGKALGSMASDVTCVLARDLDNDGDLDAVSSDKSKNIYVWENEGNPWGSWTSTDIGDAGDNVRNIDLADLDNDGDLDIISGDWGNNIYVWENNGTPWGTWTGTDIGDAGGWVSRVVAGDLDNDGWMDIVSSDGGKNVYVWKNDGTPWGSWVGTDIGDTEGESRYAQIGDLDNDGWMDIVSSDSSKNVYVWKNDGTPWGGWAKTDIGDAGYSNVNSVVLGDLDNDGWMDIASGDYAAGNPGNLYVWENDGTPFGAAWAGTDIGDAGHQVYTVSAGDLDNDGDLDLLSGDLSASIYLWENDGTPWGTWTGKDIGDGGGTVDSVSVGDLDNDGDLDLISGDQGDKLLVWQNTGGQATYQLTDLAPSVILETDSAALLKATVTHNGLASDNYLELRKWHLGFSDDAGDPLSSSEANALIDELRLYRDDGDGGWDGDDTEVFTLGTLSLTSGKQEISFTDGDTGVRIPKAGSATFFVVVTATGDGYSADPSGFKLGFEPMKDSLNEDRQVDAVVRLEESGELTTGLVEITQKPVAKIDSISPKPALDTHNVRFRGSGTVSGDIDRYVWRSSLDGELYNGSLDNFTTDLLSVGTHTIYLRIQDDGGIWSNENSSTLVITERPEASIDEVYPSPGNSRETIYFNGTGTDDGSVERYVWRSDIDGEFYNGSADEITENTLSVGNHTIYLRVQDDQGFWSEEVFTTLNVRGTPVLNVDKAKRYATISEAVEDANAGDTLKIDEASFTEEVDISKDLTIRGNDSRVTLSGNITISSGGILTLDDIILFFNCKNEDGEHGIFNNAGELYVKDSEINATNSSRGFKMTLDAISRLTGSKLRGMWQRNLDSWWLERGISVKSDDVVIESCDIGWDYRDPANKIGTAVFIDHASPEIRNTSFENCERICVLMDYSENVILTNNSCLNSFQGYYSHRSSSYRAVGNTFYNISADALTTETDAGDTWLEGNTFIDCYTRRNYQLLSGTVQVFNTTIQGTITGEFPDIKVWNGADVKSLNANFNLSYIEIGDTDARLLLKNYLSIHVNDTEGLDLEDADLKVEVDGSPVYATPGYGGGSDTTDAAGYVKELIVRDRIYENSNEAVVYNTSVFVKYDDQELVLYEINMSLSRTVWFEFVPLKRPEAEIWGVSSTPALVGDPINFDGIGDPNDSPIDTYVWSSNIDGEFHNDSYGNISYDGLSRGDHVISFKVRSNNGAWSPTVTTTVNVTYRPVGHVESIPHDPSLNTDNLEFSAWGSDDNIVDQCRWLSNLDGLLHNGPDGNFSTAGLSLGMHTLTFRVQDDHGYWSEDIVMTLNITGKPSSFIDSINPSPALEDSEVTFTGHGTDDGTIVLYAWASNIDGEFYNGSESSISYSGLSRGVHTISLRVEDDAGYLSPPVTTTLIITQQPEAEIDEIIPSPASEDQTVWFYYNATDDGVVTRYVWISNISGEIYNGTANNFSRDDLLVGLHNLTFWARDDHGFWSEEHYSELLIKTVPELSAWPSTNEAAPGDELYVTAVYTGDPTDIHFQVYYPNGTLLLENYIATTPAEGLTVSEVWDSGTAMNFGLISFKNEMYVGGMWAGKLYRSTNGGEDWKMCFDSHGSEIGAPAILNDVLYYASTDTGYIYRTSDGETWTQAYHNDSIGRFSSLIEFEGKLYAGSYNPAAVFVSDDGSSWEEVFSTGYDGISSTLVADGHLYISVQEGQTNTHFYGTEDGEIWNFLSTQNFWAPNEEGMVTLKGQNFVASFDGNVHRTSDFVSFEEVFAISQSWCLGVYHDTLFVGGSVNNADQDGDAALYMSTDGENFELIYDSPDMKACSLASYPAGDALYFSTGSHWNGAFGTINKITGYVQSQQAVLQLELPEDAPEGTYIVNVTAPMAEGQTNFDVKIPIQNPPTAVIDSITPLFANPGTQVSFMGHGEEGSSPIEEYLWTSSLDGELEDKSSFTTDELSLGHHIITFKVRDGNDLWSEETTAKIDITEPGIELITVNVPASVGLGANLQIDVEVKNNFDSEQTVNLVLQLETADHQPLDPLVETVVVGANATAWHQLSFFIPDDESPGIYSLQVQTYLALPRNEGFAFDFVNDEVVVSTGGGHRSEASKQKTRTLSKGLTSFSLEVDRESIVAGEEIIITADLSGGDFPLGTAISFEILDPQATLKYTKTFVTSGTEQVSFTLKTRENFAVGDYTIYASCPYLDGAATAERIFTVNTATRELGTVQMKQGELTAIRWAGPVILEKHDSVNNFDILQTGELSFAFLKLDLRDKTTKPPWSGKVFIYMGPETTIGLFVVNDHFYLWVDEGIVFVKTMLDEGSRNWDVFFPEGRTKGEELPMQISNQRIPEIEEEFPDEDYQLSVDIHNLEHDLFFQLSASDNDVVSMYEGYTGLSNMEGTTQTEILAPYHKALLSDSGITGNQVRAAVITAQGTVESNISGEALQELRDIYHFPLEDDHSIHIIPNVDTYPLDSAFLEYEITGKGRGNYNTTATFIENGGSRQWNWETQNEDGVKDCYTINSPWEMYFEPEADKTHNVTIREEKDGEEGLFLLKNIPSDFAGYDDKGREVGYRVFDWTNLSSLEIPSVELIHDGKSNKVSSNEDAVTAIERWVDRNGENAEGFPVLYLFTGFFLLLVVAVSLAYRTGRKEGQVEGRISSKVENHQKKKESVGSNPSQGTQQKATSFAPSASPRATPPSLTGQEVNLTWVCQSCGYQVDGKFKFCIKCGQQRGS